MTVLRLAIPSPLRRYFDYLPPPGTDAGVVAGLQPGVRLRVPFGRREVIGYLVEVSAASELPADDLKAALEILDRQPLLDARLFQLGLWAAAYYLHPPGEVFNHLFPRRLRDGKAPEPPGEAGWALTTRGKGLPADALGRSPRQAQALHMLQQQAAVPTSALHTAGITNAVLRQLRDKALAAPCHIPAAPPAAAGAGPGLDLNPDQAVIVDDLVAAAGRFGCHLVEGVTGSGKTEIYLQVIAHCLAMGRQALVLIPEIGLTPQTLDRFRSRFQATIAVLHSGLGDAQRARAWEAARAGTAHIVIGTRSAVFTPLARPGVIIVDEEHDASYKQQDGFRYCARDVAVKRGQVEDCPVVLGSATPSLESIANAAAGRYRHHLLQRRAGGARLPDIVTVDLRAAELQAGMSATLCAALDETLQGAQQVLLFLNRRGYAPTLQCHDCGWVAGCDACDARLTVHRRRGRLCCHHCGAGSPLPAACPACHSRNLLFCGLGTQQTEDFLRQRFGQWPVHRVDSDSMQGREAMDELVATVATGAPCILLGTQMLTKGHHFPGVSLVAVIDADALLFSADFRGEERMAQLLTQVAGRAGRSDRPGRVLLQTHYPDHPLLRGIIDAGYASQARELLRRRQESGMPPAGQLVILRSDCADAATGEQFLQELRRDCAADLPPGAGLIGPLPSPMQRRAGRYRSQLLLTAPERGIAHRAAALLVARAEKLPARRGLKWTIDVDPQEVF